MKIFTNSFGSESVEFSAPRPGSTLTSEIATRDIDGSVSSFYSVVQNPDPVLRKTGNYIDILDEIKREPHVSACSISRESGVLLRKWKIEQNKASKSSVDLIESLFKDLDLRQITREILEAWGYGYQVSEVVWNRVGNYLLPAMVKGKPKKWFMFGKNNELRMKTKPGDISGTEVEARKFLLTQYRSSYENPYGEAQFSLSFWPVTFKKGGLKFWSVFLEKFGMPHAVGKMSRNANPQERKELITALQRMVRDAVAVFPDDATVELLYTQVSGSADAYEGFARYHDSQISTVILGHSGATDSAPGRLGGDDSAMKVRADIIDNDTAMVQSTLNTLIKWIYEFNPSLGAERPEFQLYEPTDVDKERAERDCSLLNTGTVLLSEEYFIRKYDFDKGDIKVIDSSNKSASSATLPQFSAPAPESSNKSNLSDIPLPLTTDSQSDIDSLVDLISKSPVLQTQIEALLKPVFNLINSSESYEEINTGLAKLYPHLDDKGIKEVLEKGMFFSEIWGKLNANELEKNK